MRVRRKTALLLLAVLMLSLAACREKTVEEESVYRVFVMTDDGQPVKGAMVQLCKDVCIPGVTDERGEAVFSAAEEDYKVSVLVLPEGYDYADETREFSFAPGSREMTIRLKQK